MRGKLFGAAIALASLGFAHVVHAQGGPMAILYEHSDYQGRQEVIRGEIRDFQGLRFNDAISSIRIQGGVWEVCEHADFQGRCMTLYRDNRNLVADGFNDRISSARLVASGGFGRRDDRRDDRRDFDRRDDRGGGGGITLFQHSDFQGDSRRIIGENRNLESLRFNDEVSSVIVRSGVWELCEHSEFQGRCITVDRDIRNLTDQGFNDALSSVRRIR